MYVAVCCYCMIVDIHIYAYVNIFLSYLSVASLFCSLLNYLFKQKKSSLIYLKTTC